MKFTPGEIAIPFGYETRERADAAFEETVEQARDDAQGPGLARIRQVEHGEVVREEFIVRRPTTYA